MEELFHMFGDHHIQSTAQNALQALTMKETQRVSEYIVTFSEHAPYTGWNDTALAGQFYRGLPNRLKDAFLVVGHPHDFGMARDMALTFDQRYWERQAESNNYPRSAHQNRDRQQRSDQGSKSTPDSQKPNAQASSNSSGTSAANSGNSQKKSSGGTSNPSASNKGKGSENSSALAPRGPLTNEERERRKREKLCLYCASPDHMVRECPNVPDKSDKKATGRATYTFTPDVETKNS